MADEENDQRRSGAFGASTTQVSLKLFLLAVSLSDDLFNRSADDTLLTQKINILSYHEITCLKVNPPAKPARGASHEKLPHTLGTKEACTSSGFVKLLDLF